MNPANPRRAAVELLSRIDTEGTYSNLGIQEALGAARYTAADRRLLTRLVYGVLENRLYIDALLRSVSKTPPEKMKPWVRNALRIGVYQLFWMERVPSSAAVNESVKLVKLRYDKLSPFANGVLRTLQRQGPALEEARGEEAHSLSLRYSHPLWLVERWLDRFGAEQTVRILEADNRPAGLTLRVNPLKTAAEDLRALLAGQGVRTEPSPYLGEALQVSDLGDRELPELPAFKEGLFSIQDVSSMLVGRAAAPRPGDRILDLCAAPGGKTTHLAELMGDRGTVVARDIHPHKVRLIEEAALRLGLKSIEAGQGDAARPEAAWKEAFDHVLLDAPCSGTGIIRKKPEIRYNRTAADVESLAALQFTLLQQAGSCVKNHGQLIYSTCTMEYEENEGVVRRFLAENPDFRLVDVNSRIPEALRSPAPHISIFPGDNGLDGFFIAVMRKTASE